VSPPVAPSDDPAGGRALTRRLKVVLPIAFVAGLVVGVPVAVAVSDWRPAVVIPLAAAALAGTVAAAIEDGRVQRRVDASTGASTRTGLRAAAEAARAGDEARVRAEVERALLRGATPALVVREIDHPSWTEERVAEVARALGEPGVSPPAPPDASP
jgi:hypothetical protein